MFLTGAGVPAFAHYCAVAHHDRSHQRVRRRSVPPVLCELTGALHETVPSHQLPFSHPDSHRRRRTTALFQAFTGSTLAVFVEGSRAAQEAGSLPGFTAGAGISPAPEKLPKDKLP